MAFFNQKKTQDNIQDNSKILDQNNNSQNNFQKPGQSNLNLNNFQQQKPNNFSSNNLENHQHSDQQSAQKTIFEPVKSPFKSFLNFFRRLAVIFILIILFLSLGFVFVLINPRNQLSQLLVNKTFLKNLVTLPTQNPEKFVNKEEQKIINSIIGTQNNETQKFSFASPQTNLTSSEVAQKVLPSVLSISTKQTKNDNTFSDGTSTGSGFVVSKNGLVISNKHVISEFCNSNDIQFFGLTYDQKVYELELLSIDPIDDIAILQIKNLKEQVEPVTFGDSSKLKLGQDVLAVGNALGELQNTVTKGIVSGLNRVFETKLVDNCTQNKFAANNLIQTDAAINKGNSGGPLFDAFGHFVGMNTLTTDDSENIAFALPSATIQKVLNIFTKKNQIIRPNLELDYVNITPSLKLQNPWIPVEKGVILFDQDKNGFVSNTQTGLKEFDIITEINDKEIGQDSFFDKQPIKSMIMLEEPNSRIKIKVWKLKNSENKNYEYEKEAKTFEITLGSASFDLKTKKIQYQK
jgi:serine protease Do